MMLFICLVIIVVWIAIGIIASIWYATQIEQDNVYSTDLPFLLLGGALGLLIPIAILIVMVINHPKTIWFKRKE